MAGAVVSSRYSPKRLVGIGMKSSKAPLRRPEHTVIDDLIERFGGGSEVGLARAFKIGRSTVIRWHRVGYIPPDTPWRLVKRVESLSGISDQILTQRYVKQKDGADGTS